jgi:hypothetical protein
MSIQNILVTGEFIRFEGLTQKWKANFFLERRGGGISASAAYDPKIVDPVENSEKANRVAKK